MESISLYSEARTEYMKQLSIWVVPPLVEFYRKEYNSLSEKEGKRTMAAFQKYCADVPLWNQDVIDTNIGVLLDNCRCDYVEELMTAVFIAHTKMLTAIRMNNRQKKLQITLPKLDHFLHRVFVECARAFWKAPFLFADDLTPVERQKNILQAEFICTEALSGAVRTLLPVKSILKDYLEDDAEEGESESNSVQEDTKKPTENVKAPVKLEQDDLTDTSVVDEVIQPMKPVKEVVEAETISNPVIEEVVKPTKTDVAEKPVVESDTVKPVIEEVIKLVESETLTKPVIEEVMKVVDTDTLANVVEEVKPILSTNEPNQNAVQIEKLETSPILTSPNPSSEKSLQIEPKDVVHLEKLSESMNLKIDTEQTVHFTPYDTVFDETTQNISEIRYTPKISVEDKPSTHWDDAPKLQIGSTSSDIELKDVVNLDADIDTPLSNTLDFEELS